MSFNNDDLKRLKELTQILHGNILNHKPELQGFSDYDSGYFVNSIESLLSRLEAAEKTVDCADYLIGFIKFPPKTEADHRIKDFMTSLEAWRKAAGE